MEVVGWFLTLMIAGFFSVGALLLLIGGSMFSGRISYEFLIPGVIAALLWWAVIANYPFTPLVLKSSL